MPVDWWISVREHPDSRFTACWLETLRPGKSSCWWARLPGRWPRSSAWNIDLGADMSFGGGWNAVDVMYANVELQRGVIRLGEVVSTGLDVKEE